MPAHPTHRDPASRRLPRTEQPWAFLQLDGYNVFYRSRSERAYLRLVRRPGLRAAIREAQAAALAHALTQYPLDPNHVVCTGISASGSACWDLAIHWPGVFAGVWPVSAGYPVDAQTCWQNLDQQQIYMMHGAADPKIREEWVTALVQVAQKAGATVEVHRVEGAGHGTFDEAVWQAGFDWAAALGPPQTDPRDRCDRPRRAR